MKTLSLLLVLQPLLGISSFSVLPSHAVRPSSTKLPVIRLLDKYFQMEELEDKENISTEIHLKPDNTVAFGETDGPPPAETVGVWTFNEDENIFEMKVVRTFGAGLSGTNIGEFDFGVERTYVGIVTKVGNAVAVSGSIRLTDDLTLGGGDKVGFFNLIDTTEIRSEVEAARSN